MEKQNTILCVDDEQNVLKSLQRTLREEGYNIVTALSGQEGLKILDSEKIDLIIADQRMPQMTGIEFIKKAREKYADIICIMLSGYSDIIEEKDVFRFIHKPWDDHELKTIIRCALNTKGMMYRNN